MIDNIKELQDKIGEPMDLTKIGTEIQKHAKKPSKLKGKRTLIFNAVVLPSVAGILMMPEMALLLGPWAGLGLVVAGGINSYLRLITDTAVGKSE